MSVGAARLIVPQAQSSKNANSDQSGTLPKTGRCCFYWLETSQCERSLSYAVKSTGKNAHPTVVCRPKSHVSHHYLERDGFSRNSDWRHGESAEFVLIRTEFHVGVQSLFPGDHLSGIGRHTAHDCSQGAFGDELAFV